MYCSIVKVLRKKETWLFILAALFAIVPIIPVYASASYYANIQVVESNGTSYGQLGIMVDVDNTYLAVNGYIDSDGLDTEVITGATSLHHLIADDKVLFATSITHDSTANFKYTFGNTPVTDMDIIVGYDGFVTVADAAALEPGNNPFEIIISDVYLDFPVVGTSYIIEKTLATSLWITNAGAVNWKVNGNVIDTCTVAGLTDGEYTITLTSTGNGGTFTLDVDGTSDSQNQTAGFSNSINDWILFDDNSTPYVGAFTYEINGVPTVEYNPENIISGTTLPDLEGVVQNGVITWGANPVGIAESIGALVSYSAPEPVGTGSDIVSQEVAGDTGQPGWTTDVGTLTTNPLYPMVLAISDNTNFSVQQVWVIGAIFIICAAMAVCFKFVPHQLITVAVGCSLDVLFYSMGIFPFWTIFIFAIMGIALVLWERVPSV